METELRALVINVKKAWNDRRKIQSLLEEFSQKESVIRDLTEQGREDGRELYRDESGFILFAYSELEGKYRGPHNHGDGWVIYTVVAGEVEMGSFKRVDNEKVILTDKKSLKAGDGRLYQVGDIHDTKCLANESIILRFTSCDLKVEEQKGRMLRFKL